MTSDVKEGYLVGCRPPGLDKAGSFPHPTSDFRVFAFIDGSGSILSVDMKTKLLVEENGDD